MGLRYKRRIRAAAGAAVAAGVVPLVLTTSAPMLPTAHVGRSAGSAQSIYFAMAGLAGDRAAMLDESAAGALAPGPGSRGGKVAVRSPKGTRVWTASALSDHGLPVAAEKAYRRAAALSAESDPGCGLPWTLLAGIGRVESDHGRYGGSRLGTDGVSQPRIIGVPLNGAGPVAAIRDTDDGRLDRDRVWDRAVGPMQFIPSTWSSAARDGDGDGRRSPHDLDDAAAAAASYLCSGSGSMLDPASQAAAIFRYNPDDYYVALVQAFETGYRTGVFVMPSPPVDEEPAKARHRKRRDARGDEARAPERRTRTSTPGPVRETVSKPRPARTRPAPPSAPRPSPTPKPSPTPAPTVPTTRIETGSLTQEGGSFYLNQRVLDLGAAGSKVGAQELSPLAGQQVKLEVFDAPSGGLGVVSIIS
jgi:membrane-bound lytic murein transglycosylase B